MQTDGRRSADAGTGRRANRPTTSLVTCPLEVRDVDDSIYAEVGTEGRLVRTSDTQSVGPGPKRSGASDARPVGRPADEATLVRLSAQLESAHPCTARRPQVS
jgi:hypothetical protein